MTRVSSPRQRTFFYLITFGALAAALCWVMAASPLSPHTEEITSNGVPLQVDYAASASSQDLMLPFHPDAKVEQSFAYTVTTKDGEQVAYYASALLTSPDPPDKIAAAYSARLPERPEPEVLEDKSGKRYVLAVAGEDEVREITIAPQESGSRIQLVRASSLNVPPPVPTPPPRFAPPRRPFFRGPRRHRASDSEPQIVPVGPRA